VRGAAEHELGIAQEIVAIVTEASGAPA